MEDPGLLSAFVDNLVSRLFSLVEEKYKLYKGFEGDVTFLMRELPIITSAIDGQLLGQDDHILRLSVEELRHVAYEMEDCIYHIIKRKSRSQLGEEMQHLRYRLEEALQRQQRYSVSHSSSSQLAQSSWDQHVLPDDLVAIDAPLEELLEQLAEAEGQPKQLRVISVVGFSGLGKTILARELYNSEIGKQFEERARVSGTHGDPGELLSEILRQLNKPDLVTSNVNQLSADLCNFLNNKSSTHGYIHKMRRLDEKHSKQLFLRNACPGEYSDYLQPDSAAILNKCDDQPLALTTVAHFMQKKSWPTGQDCEDVCNKARFYDLQSGDDTLDRMHQVLTHDYASLPSHALKACFLYFAMFPSDHPVRAKKIKSQWIAEGFLQPTNLCNDPAAENFEKLMNQNIIQPINVSINTKVKTCKTYGMMHEFITLKSLCENFITLFDGGDSSNLTMPDASNDPRSFSLYFDGCSEDFLKDLKAPCYLRSLKLQGRLLELPGFVTALRRLRELHLQSTKMTADLLTALTNLTHLQYLKLIADELEEIHINNKGLPRLLGLCFVLQRPTFPKVEEGALPFLKSLQLLCKDMNGLCGIQIKGFTRLSEIMLDCRVTDGTKANWVRAAKEHPNRPIVVLKRAIPPKVDHDGDSTAAGETENEIVDRSVLSEEQVQETHTQMPHDETDSAFNNMGQQVICAALTGSSIANNGRVAS
uniref:NB-ARC domain-containing protein n=1 Tax=Setaria italica TaxID=4555 RepID=K3ZHI7_SETIT